MIDINSSKSLRTRLSHWLLLLTLVPLIFVLVINYFQRVDVIQARTFDKLTAIRDLKVQQLSDWLDERVGDMYSLSYDKELLDLEFLLDPSKSNNSNNAKILLNLRHHLQRYFKYYPDYYDFSILNAKNGVIVASTKEFTEGQDKSLEKYFTETIEKRELVIQDIHYSRDLSNPTMTFSIPIFNTNQNNEEILGVLVARINLHNSLYKLLLNRVGLGETGETLIVNTEGQALNELRWYENAPLNLKISADPAVNAAQGKTGFSITTDYRNEEVLAAYTHIPETTWGFVCKQDVYELNTPIRNMMRDFLILFIIITLIISLLVVKISNSISKPIVEINNVALQLKAGNYSVRNRIKSKDELGALSEEFNNMAEVIESKMKIQKGVADISETMIEKTSMKDFGHELLLKLMEVTEAKMSAFFILNESTSEFEYFASISANQDLLKPFNASSPEGEFGNVVINKKISYLTDIPEDTVFKYKTTAGDIIPKEIITIPVIVESTVIAIVSLISIKTFSQDCRDIIEQSWRGINTSYSNLIASERTSVFADHLSRINQQLETQSRELTNRTDEMQEQAKELQRTSDELQKQNNELEVRRQQVEAANQLKSEFLSNMSHELRTPLNSIMALSRVLIMQANQKLNNDENNYLVIIERNGKRLLSLINDILDLSKIEAGKMEIIPEFVSINSLMNIIKDNLQSLSDEKNIELILNMPEKLPLVETDESRLHQVLLNIASNAIKFTEKGSVEINVYSDTVSIFVTIKDTGIGISPNVINHIFDEFRQGDGTSSRRYEGTGLGLAIAKKIITILGGNISVESVLEKGSVFTINIPIIWHESNQITKIIESHSSPDSLNKNTILIIDDDKDQIRDLSNYLIDVGFDILSAQNGVDGIRLAEEHNPDAITLDIVMPEMDGWEVLQKLKSDEKTKDIPVIIVSVTPDRETGFALGAIGYVNKPIDKKSLFSEIELLNKLPNTVMIVDDNIFDRNQIVGVIEQNKIKTIQASGGKDCIALLEKQIPDILVLDLLMPDMDGISVLKKIRSNEKTKDLSVIIVTAKNLTKEEKMMLNGRVSSVITKSETSSEKVFEEIIRLFREIELKNKNKKKNILVVENPIENIEIIDKPFENETYPVILVVEDNLDNLITIKAILGKRNKIFTAVDGEEGLNMAVKLIPDIILLDMSLPKMSGKEIVKILKQKVETKNIPVIAVTAQAMRGDKESFLEVGCDDYISKPIDPKIIKLKVETWLSKK